MNNKIFFLICMQICLFTMKSSAQLCFNTGFFNPMCIMDQHVINGSTYWYPSAQGGLAINPLTFSNNNAPGSTGQSLYLWSFAHTGQGAYTCYNFKKDSTYSVCFWIRHIHQSTRGPSNWFGKFKVYAADFQFTSGTGSWAFFNEQFIDSSYGPYKYLDYGQQHPWEFISATFTADSDYNALWLYPDNPAGLPPAGNPWLSWSADYEVEVDDIRVKKVSGPSNITVTGNNFVLNGCNGQVQLNVNGMPPNTIATWTPAPFIQNANGSVVTVMPCSTTVYEIIVTDTTDSCATCLNEILYDTIYVNPWADSLRLIYPTTTIPCTDTISLDYNDPNTCPGVTYTWVDPQGNPVSSIKNPTIIANATYTGEWTLQIGIPNGCIEELKFPITVGSCCISSPSFTFTPNNNPVNFTYTGTGIINHKATLWNFGDGTTSDLDNPIHTYNVTKRTRFTVCLTTLFEDEQGEGCCNRVCKTVVVDPSSNICIVVADFNYEPTPGWDNKFDFTDISSGSGTICDYFWDFGDGTPIVHTNVPNINHLFATTGPWTVCLKAVNCVYDATGNFMQSCTTTKCTTVYPNSNMMAKRSLGNPLVPQQQPVSQSFEPHIENPGNDNVLTVYPNPTQGSFAINLYKRTGNYWVVVRDKLGHEVYNRRHMFSNVHQKIILNDISDGTYSVEVMNDNEKFVQQISIVR